MATEIESIIGACPDCCAPCSVLDRFTIASVVFAGQSFCCLFDCPTDPNGADSCAAQLSSGLGTVSLSKSGVVFSGNTSANYTSYIGADPSTCCGASTPDCSGGTNPSFATTIVVAITCDASSGVPELTLSALDGFGVEFFNATAVFNNPLTFTNTILACDYVNNNIGATGGTAAVTFS